MSCWIMPNHFGSGYFPDPAAALSGGGCRARARWTRGGARRRRGVLVRDALGIRAAVALELRLDPIDRGAVAIGALAPVTELGEAFHGRLVPLEIEACDHQPDGIIGGIRRRRTGWRLRAPGRSQRDGA